MKNYVYQRFFLLLFLFVFGKTAIAQLSGPYTVGQPTDDYPSIGAALGAILANGTNGNVELRISTGNYQTLWINSFIPPNGDTVFITSAAKSKDSVVFNDAVIKFSENIYLSHLGFTTSNGVNDAVVEIDRCKNISISNCIIQDTVNFYSYGLLYIRFDFSGIIADVFVDSTNIYTLGNLNAIPAATDAINVGGKNGRAFFEYDTIIGNLAMKYGAKSRFKNSFIRAAEISDDDRRLVFSSCSLKLDNRAFTAVFALRADSVIQSVINGNISYARTSVDAIIESSICIPMSFNYESNSSFQRNTFYAGLDFSFCSNATLNRNQFKDFVSFAFPKAILVMNNFFFDTVIVHFDNLHLINNSFSIGSYLEYISSGSVVNNNIHAFAKGNAFIPKFERNNFTATDIVTRVNSYDDAAPSYYNPGYVSSSDLHISNPSLFSRGKYQFSIKEDFDGNLRGAIRSVGATEHCLNWPLPDTILYECGSEYILRLCDTLQSIFVWKPDSAFLGGNNANPIIQVNGTKKIWLEDSVGTKVDSVFVVAMFPNVYGNRNYYTRCGLGVPIETYVPPSSVVKWSPQYNITNAYANHTFVSPDSTVRYVAKITTPSCGVFFDTITVNVNETPNANFYENSTEDCLKKYFTAGQTCIDSALWDFGDGTSSTQMPVSHVFPKSGSYPVTLKLWYNGLLSSTARNIYVSCLGVNEFTENDASTIYPIPNNGHFVLQRPTDEPTTIYIYNSQGEQVFKQDSFEAKVYLDIEVSNGVYFVVYTSHENTIRQKVVIIN